MVRRRIARVRLHNYRSHKDTDIEGIGRLAAFVGENSAGKSNVFKGIEMVCLNGDFPERCLYRDKTTGKAAKEGSAEVWFEDGAMIGRYRDGKKQWLVMREADGAEQTMHTIRDCADLVAEFTGFRRAALDKSRKTGECIQIVPLEDNRPFLIAGDSPATVLRKVNTLADGAAIEKAKARMQTSVRSLKDQRRGLSVSLDAARQAVDGLRDDRWDSVRSDVSRAKAAAAEQARVTEGAQAVAEACEEYVGTMELLSKCGAVSVEGLEDVRKQIAALQYIEDSLDSIREDAESYVAECTEMAGVESQIAEAQAEYASLLTPTDCEKCGRCVVALGGAA